MSLGGSEFLLRSFSLLPLDNLLLDMFTGGVGGRTIGSSSSNSFGSKAGSEALFVPFSCLGGSLPIMVTLSEKVSCDGD